MRGVVLGWECSDVNEVSLVHGGHSYNVRIGKLTGSDKRVFTVYRGGGVCVLQGSGYNDAAFILKTVIGVIERREYVGNIYHDADGNIRVNKARGLPK